MSCRWVAREGLADGVAAGGVEPLQVKHEPPLQGTHLAGGDVDAVLGPQRLADFFALVVMDEALQSGEDHHVVAHRLPRRQAVGQAGSPPCDFATRGLAAASEADMDALAGLERAVLQGPAGARHRLLHAHGAPAAGARARLLDDGDLHRAKASPPLPAALLHQLQQAPQLCQGPQVGGAVFFPGVN